MGYGVNSFNASSSFPPNSGTWLNDMSDEVESNLKDLSNGLDLPDCNLLFANPLQRVIIGMNFSHLLNVALSNDNVPPLRLLIQSFGEQEKHIPSKLSALSLEDCKK